MMHFWDAYKNTHEYKDIVARLNQIEETIKQNEERKYGYYQRQVIGYHGLFSVFQTCKENYNVKKGMKEDISNHFCRDFEHFQMEADERYQTHIADRTKESITHLSKTHSTSGKKLSQTEVRIPSES